MPADQAPAAAPMEMTAELLEKTQRMLLQWAILDLKSHATTAMPIALMARAGLAAEDYREQRDTAEAARAAAEAELSSQKNRHEGDLEEVAQETGVDGPWMYGGCWRAQIPGTNVVVKQWPRDQRGACEAWIADFNAKHVEHSPNGWAHRALTAEARVAELEREVEHHVAMRKRCSDDNVALSRLRITAEAQAARLREALQQAVDDWSGETSDERAWLANARAALTPPSSQEGDGHG